MISKYLSDLDSQLQMSEPGRHSDLIGRLATWIVEEYQAGNRPQINFICTHNSRRSQFAQTWSTLVQEYLGVNIVESFSGGTEVTACNERTVAALQRAGLNVNTAGDDNPVYTVSAPGFEAEVRLWSKKYDDDPNPTRRFAAVMTCDHADANCPFIPGAAVRFPLTYTDPKYADGTDEEKEAYDTTCAIIAADMLRIYKQVKRKLSN